MLFGKFKTVTTFTLLIAVIISPAQISKLEKQDYLTARGMFDDEMYELAMKERRRLRLFDKKK